MTEEIMVSVFCMTYQHRDCIRDALEGFVSQQTTFRFEVLVHDDASTDGTADIVREYAERYPDIIKPILQTENQYSKGTGIIGPFMIPIAKGKYVAFCEGDDYWVDPRKLQKQFELLEAHPEYWICTSRAVFADHDSGRCTVRPKQAADRVYTTEEVIMVGGLYFATATIFMRMDAYLQKPDCFRVRFFGDWQLFIYGSMGGGCYCMQDVTAVYNNKRKGSYTEKTWKDSVFRDTINQEAMKLLRQIDEYYAYRYHDAIQSKMRQYEYRLLKYQGRVEEIQGEEYAEYRILDEAKQKLREIQG